MSDANTPMEPGEEPTREQEEPGGRRGTRLLRSRDDRMVAGVAAGLGDYFNVDPTIVRIAFAISVFFGGLGAFAYVVLALVVPNAGAAGEGPEPAPIERSRGLAAVVGLGILVIAASWGFFDGGGIFHDGGWIFGPPLFLIAVGFGLYLLLRNTGNSSAAGIVGKIVLAIALLAAAGVAATASAWAGATGHGVAIAIVVIAIGALLILSAFRGGARWLVAPAAVLAVPLALVAAADVSFGDGIGEREYNPTSIGDIPANGYELGVGRLAIDLRDLEWDSGERVDLDLDLGIGEAVVAVPENVCISADADVRLGEVNVAGTRSGGFDAEVDRADPSAAAPQLEIKARADLGAVRVINDDDADLDDHDRGWEHWDDDEEDEELEERLEAACAEAAGRSPAGEPGDRGGRAGSGAAGRKGER